MNYDQQLQTIIINVKADKAIIQPWRNKAVARLEEVQAFIDRGTKLTNLKQPDGIPTTQTSCICPNGGLDTRCPVHGG